MRKLLIAKPYVYIEWFLHTSPEKKRTILFLIFLTIGIIALLIFLSSRKHYTYTLVKRGNITKTITNSGNVIIAGEADIYTTTNGVIENLYVENGSHVTQGEKLFQVRSTATDQEKATAYASYQSAIANAQTADQNKILLQSQLEAARKQVIDASNAVTNMNNNINVSANNPATNKPYVQNEIDSINSSLTSARENFSGIEKKYKEVNETITAAQANQNATLLTYQETQDATITAPVDGEVTNLANAIGDKVLVNTPATPSFAANPLNPVLILGNLQNLMIKIQLNEDDITPVKIGQKVTISFDAITNTMYYGHVVKLDNVGTNTQGVITYNVYCVIDNPDDRIKPTMTANVVIQTLHVTDVLLVPNSALIHTQGEKAVQVIPGLDDTYSQVRSVQIGVQDATDAEVIQGLHEGEKVVTGNL